jgi:hypothetical protein
MDETAISDADRAPGWGDWGPPGAAFCVRDGEKGPATGLARHKLAGRVASEPPDRDRRERCEACQLSSLPQLGFAVLPIPAPSILIPQLRKGRRKAVLVVFVGQCSAELSTYTLPSPSYPIFHYWPTSARVLHRESSSPASVRSFLASKAKSKT